VTSIRDDSLVAPPAVPAPPLPAPAAATPADRHLAHLALVTGAVLLSLAVLVAISGAVLRGMRSPRRTTAAD
jgi:hypothetical protein